MTEIEVRVEQLEKEVLILKESFKKVTNIIESLSNLYGDLNVKRMDDVGH
jgi:hypothetical protein